MPKTAISVTALGAYFVPAFRGGGPIRTLEALVNEHTESLDVSIICTNRDLGIVRPLDVPVDKFVPRAGASVYYIDWASTRSKIRAISAIRTLDSEYLYLNSLFSPWFSIAPLLLRKLGVVSARAVVIAPRGELGHGALTISHNKKRFFLKCAKSIGLHHDVIWHASSEQEKHEIAQSFQGSTVIVRENEVNLPDRPLPPVEIIRPSRLRSVFVGRLSPKKGLHVLLSALQHVPHSLSLDIYGEFENADYRDQVSELIADLPSHISATLNGSINHSSVRSIFSQFEVFLFPTVHENFGHVIAESLSASCPVILADVTPFSGTVAAGGGVVLSENDASSWADAISVYASLNAEARNDRRQQAGKAYTAWRATKDGPSVFELIPDREEN